MQSESNADHYANSAYSYMASTQGRMFQISKITLYIYLENFPKYGDQQVLLP